MLLNGNNSYSKWTNHFFVLCPKIEIINFQNPIAVQLFGISTNKDVNFDRIRLNLYPIPAEDRKGYPLFFRDSPVARKSTPVVSLSKKLIDFGRVLKFEKVKVRSGRTLTLTNHSNNDLNIQWFGRKLNKTMCLIIC